MRLRRVPRNGSLKSMTDKIMLDALSGVWEKHPDEERRRKQSHWRGHGRWADEERWRNIGRTSTAKFNALMTHIAPRRQQQPDSWMTAKSFLEWGPGGGANMYAFLPFARHYFGVDISQKNLEECARLAAEENLNGFRPVLLDDEPGAIVGKVTEPINMFLSTAVFQHFPSKDYGAEVLRALHAVTAPRAIGHIQIRYGRDRYATVENPEQYMERYVTATSYSIGEFRDLCAKCGFKTLFLSNRHRRTHYVTFNLIRKK